MLDNTIHRLCRSLLPSHRLQQESMEDGAQFSFGHGKGNRAADITKTIRVEEVFPNYHANEWIDKTLGFHQIGNSTTWRRGSASLRVMPLTWSFLILLGFSISDFLSPVLLNGEDNIAPWERGKQASVTPVIIMQMQRGNLACSLDLWLETSKYRSKSSGLRMGG